MQSVLAGRMPIIFGLICGVVLRTSGAVFIALPIGIAGGRWAGLEHVGLLFGASILVGHHLAGGSDRGLLPNPELLQVLITMTMGTLLGLLGARSRKRIDSSTTCRHKASRYGNTPQNRTH